METSSALEFEGFGTKLSSCIGVWGFFGEKVKEEETGEVGKCYCFGCFEQRA